MKRNKRRADGSLRPAEARYRKRKNAERRKALPPEEREQRRLWLSNFHPGARQHFFRHANTKEAIWLRSFSRILGLPEEECAPLLEKYANERGWMKLRTKSGMVVGAAVPKKRRKDER